MIEGLRYLPELQARRDQQIQDGLRPDFLDCDDCLVTKTRHDRRCLGCGFLPEGERFNDGMRPFPEASVCPGYSVRLPEVIEAARALSWSKKGGLVPLYGERALPACAVDAIDVLDGAAGKVERDILRRQRERVADGQR